MVSIVRYAACWRLIDLSDYAQTNIQLYGQLWSGGYSEAELLAVTRVYKLAMQGFALRFRSNGKPFLPHLVGTASILASLGSSRAVVAAGLVHAAYAQGDYGDSRPGITPEKQRLLRRELGEEVEQLLAGYQQLPWKPEAIRALQARSDSWTERERDLLLMRLANELEDNLDCGMLYGSKQKYTGKDSDCPAILCEMADRLGYAALRDELRSAFAQSRSAALPDSFRSQAEVSFSLKQSRPWEELFARIFALVR